ncbi:hypothetical protein [Methanococcus aeolicus]|uniref:Uncharacterized protein n=1 Tax=Methanococcus aeolicus (strain ATCC BAA-1280 / DSM 17508 / OCM 812 / Nankai-3) TaxID=419665 RepID=A6UUG3_META3|nr:hypothetical protein [Methanococcus aeolicus]ABR56135.1 hypothetical protein Maeo_0550 [Methanococcus aeolicus Nankai-3]UXM85254.1 hypothetical protein N6C89_02960 [Methanococcus aeolicus]
MKKRQYVLYGLLFSLILTMSYGHEQIDVGYGKMTNDGIVYLDIIYVNYNISNLEPFTNFSLTAKADNVDFNNSSIYMPYVENTATGNLTGIITGKKLDNYKIVVSLRYYLNNSLVSKIMIYNIINITDKSNMAPNSETTINNESIEIENNTINNTIIKNIENGSSPNTSSFENITTNINKDNNLSKNITNIENGASSNNMWYIVMGLIMGAIVAITIIFLYDIK